MCKSHCAFVTQYDRSWTFLSPREQLDLAHAFFQASLKREARMAATEALLKRVGLASCAELQAGTDVPEEMGPAGLSGGQRRRLSLAVALAKKPALLMADEPTSGLDAAAAAAVMKVLRDLAEDERVAVLCTIHQPSASVFGCIGQLLILSKGLTVYLGQGHELVQYTASLGRPIPVGMSVSEHMLNLVNSDFASDAEVHAIIAAWQKRAPSLPPLPPEGGLPAEPQRASLARQFRLLLLRHVVKMLPRDPLAYIVVCALSTFDICIMGLYFWPTLRYHDQRDPRNRLSFVVMGTAMPMLYTMLYTISVSVERVRVKREVSNGMYDGGLYVVVTTLIALPMSYLISALAVLLVFVWGDLYWGGIPYALLLNGAAQFWMMCVAQTCGWLFGTVTGPAVFGSFWAISFCSCPRPSNRVALCCIRVASWHRTASPCAASAWHCVPQRFPPTSILSTSNPLDPAPPSSAPLVSHTSRSRQRLLRPPRFNLLAVASVVVPYPTHVLDPRHRIPPPRRRARHARGQTVRALCSRLSSGLPMPGSPVERRMPRGDR